jgi:hypothetical protein
VICAGELGPVIPAYLPARTGLAARRAPDQGAAGVLPRAGEDLGAGRPRGHDLRDHRQPVQPRQQEHPGLAGRPSPDPARLHPKGACWLNLQEGWWRIFRRQALAGQDFAGPDEIAHATRVATAQLNARARPGSGDGPSPDHVPTAGALYTPFKERSTSRLLSGVSLRSARTTSVGTPTVRSRSTEGYVLRVGGPVSDSSSGSRFSWSDAANPVLERRNRSGHHTPSVVMQLIACSGAFGSGRGSRSMSDALTVPTCLHGKRGRRMRFADAGSRAGAGSAGR